MRRRDLEAWLETVPRPERPSERLEQVRTPPAVAADLLTAAAHDGAVSGRRVLDLGCGTGILAWGAAALGAGHVLGVDVDPAMLATAAEVRPPAGSAAVSPEWLEADVASWRPERSFDTVVMNPPFGAQHANRHADRAFYACAADAVAHRGSVWFLAQAGTQGFLERTARSLGADVVRVGHWRYPLEAYWGHHREQARLLDVGGYRLRWPGS